MGEGGGVQGREAQGFLEGITPSIVRLRATGGEEQMSTLTHRLQHLQEGGGGVGHDGVDLQPRAQVLQEALQEGDEVLRPADVARHRFPQHVVWEYRIG